jgi:glycosyltransferase involved in cell wall biosynthesis
MPSEGAPGPVPVRMPTRFHKPLAIVPAYNEERCVGSVVDEIRLHCPEFEVLVVDDGSTDETARAAADAGASVVRLPFNLGIGGAVQAGYQYAYDRGHDLAVQIDGDGQHDPAQIRTLMRYLERHPDLQMVTGSRFLDGSDVNGYKSSPIRRVGIRIFQWALSAVTGQRITDPTSGFRMTTRRGIEVFARDYPHDYPEVEAIVMLHAHRLSSAEVPCSMRARAGGRSSINTARSGYYMIKVLLAVFVNLLRSRPSVEAGDRAPVTAEHAL